ncbi:MAG: Rieske 2Fe-2S domain-containing protein [Gemmatimonadales bacterium]|jgi:nitrite reductase/ring-hydroxylating ferredoxin subunit
MPRAEHTEASSSPACEACPLVERRAFLGQAALVLAGVVAALGGAPGKARALPLRFGRALAASGDLLTYPIPAADGAQIDHDNQTILVRYQQKVFAFNLSCPHQNTALHWQPEDGIFQCPKHHSRYQPDGTFISGRATRSMDRFGLRRDAANVIVNVAQFYRQDRNPAEWTAAVVAL